MPNKLRSADQIQVVQHTEHKLTSLLVITTFLWAYFTIFLTAVFALDRTYVKA